MRRSAPSRIALALALAVCASMGCKRGPSPGASAAGDSGKKAVLHATGTIVSVEERPHDEQSVDLLPGPRVCFTIDSFDEVAAKDRTEYESAERARGAAHGPRCHDTAVDPSAVHFKAGDRLDVFFTVENAIEISVVKISAHCVDL